MLSSCYQSKSDIYNQIPKGTKLTLEIIKQSSSVFKVDGFLVLIYPLKDSINIEKYNPHLIFFNSKKELDAASYFLSESVFKINEDTIISYLNEYRKLRIHNFREDIPKGVFVKYQNYQGFIGGGGGITNTNLLDIKYDNVEGTVDFYLKTANNKIREISKIPLHRITFDYEKQEIMINDVIKEKEKKIIYFSISKTKLDLFFKQIITSF
jgi:hypothetical protein